MAGRGGAVPPPPAKADGVPAALGLDGVTPPNAEGVTPPNAEGVPPLKADGVPSGEAAPPLEGTPWFVGGGEVKPLTGGRLRLAFALGVLRRGPEKLVMMPKAVGAAVLPAGFCGAAADPADGELVGEVVPGSPCDAGEASAGVDGGFGGPGMYGLRTGAAAPAASLGGVAADAGGEDAGVVDGGPSCAERCAALESAAPSAGF